MTIRKSIYALAGIGLCACSQNASDSPTQAPAPPVSPEAVSIQLNQLGFYPQQHKQAIISSSTSQAYSVTDLQSGEVVLSGESPTGQFWPAAGESASVIDLTSVTQPGQYRISLTDSTETADFVIAEDAYGEVHDAAIKAYYYNRASTALDPIYAGEWARAAGHPDNEVMVHESAATESRPAGTLLSAPKGWYDAGDYNKYIVNSGISTYTLMRAYTDFAALYADRQWGLPESDNGRADLLDEIRWNLDWMQAMQDRDGGVYHKLTTLQFSGEVMPEDATAQRYVVQKGTAASLNFAAVFAMASRLYPEMASAYLEAAEQAWQWASAHPDVEYQNPSDVATGEYGDAQFSDEFAWAAAELFLATQDSAYLAGFWQHDDVLSTPGWSNTRALGYVSLLSDGGSLLTASDQEKLKSALVTYADKALDASRASPYGVAMTDQDFVWGSNGVALNKAMMLFKAWQLTDQTDYQTAAVGLLDYTLGRNPLGMSYVTGFGLRSPMHIHHRPSQADNVVAPVPGFLAGGAQNGHQDRCEYTSSLPATSYVDGWCSYSTNEVTINWNAPLVYMLAAMLSSQS